MKHLYPIYCCLWLFLCPNALFSQSLRDIVDGARLLEDLFGNEDTTQCNPPNAAQSDTTANWDETMHTSDMDNQTSTQYRHNANNLPKGSKRVGCVCMDNTKQDEGGRGSCSGHGGVRFWQYVTPDAELIEVPTERHYQHPNDLSPEELAQLASQYENHTPPNSSATNMNALVQIIMVMMVCSTAAFIVKQIWNNA